MQDLLPVEENKQNTIIKNIVLSNDYPQDPKGKWQFTAISK